MATKKSSKIVEVVEKAPRGYRYEVKDGGKVVACGVRTHEVQAERAAAREASVYQSVNAPKGSAPSRKVKR